MSDVQSWFEMAQKVGSGAAFILGIGMIFLWRAYTKELEYSKSRDTQTITVLLNLTKIVENLEQRDRDFLVKQETTAAAVMVAINGLRELIVSHYVGMLKAGNG